MPTFWQHMNVLISDILVFEINFS